MNLEKKTAWEFFFQCQKAPMLRSQLLTALMAGTALEVERIPNGALLDAVMLSTAAREACEAEVVDDWRRLLERTEELWRMWCAADATVKPFDSTHACWVNFIINHGTRHFEDALVRYVPTMVKWYLDNELPVYFKREVTK